MPVVLGLYAFAAAVLGLSLLFLRSKGPALFMLQLIMAPIVLAMRANLRKAAVIFCAAGCAAAAAQFVYGIDRTACVITAVVFSAAPLFIRRLNRQFQNNSSAFERELKEMKLDYLKYEEQLQAIDTYNKNVEHHCSEISGLYEIMKEMSSTLSFTDIFRILNDFLKKKFFFRRLGLILTSPGKDMPDSATCKAYQIAGSYSVEEIALERKLEEMDMKLFELFKKDPKRSLFLIRPDHDQKMREFAIPAYIKSFVAIPLVIENSIVGLVTGEDFQPEEFEKLVILSSEIALEMKKVLLYEAVQEMAIMDGLTNIYVRRHFLERFDDELDRAKGHGLNLAFVMIDVDDFKSVNDNYGHLVGDAVLREIAGILKTNIREIDLVGRYGGEEFAVVLPETPKESAYQLAERIRQIIAGYTFKAYDEALKLTLSIGVSGYPDDGSAKAVLMDKADMALYEAKEKGKNAVVVYQRTSRDKPKD